MKVGIITFHRADNYGAVLQTYALQQVFESFDCNVSIIDYRCPAIENEYGSLRFPKLCKNIFLWLKRIPQWYISKPLIEKKTERFSAFRLEYLHMSNSVHTELDRQAIEKKYDLIVTGSDQVWNPSIIGGIDKWFYYSKTSKEHGVTVASYAASIGNINEYEPWFNKTRDYIQKYDFISVREIEFYNYLCEKMPDRNINLCVDPTLLVNKEHWFCLSKSETGILDPYLLYYDAAPNDLAKTIALRIADVLKLKLVHYSSSLCGVKGSICVADSGPLDFLSYFRNASFVVTSSFHGTVFSLVFGKKFVSVVHPCLGGRIKDLLSIVQLENRMCLQETANISEYLSEIDYNTVYNKLDVYRTTSLNYIKQITSNHHFEVG